MDPVPGEHGVLEPDVAVIGEARPHLPVGGVGQVDPEPAQFLVGRSSHDDREIQAWLLKPPGFDPKKKYPLILEIHGGPHANYGERFSAEMQLFAAAGYVVLYVNPRGSTGYGQEFASLIQHAYPGHDYDDLMSAVDATLERGFIDREQLNLRSCHRILKRLVPQPLGGDVHEIVAASSHLH